MATSKLLKSFISNAKIKKARTLFNKYRNNKLTAREVEKELNNLGLRSDAPYNESKKIDMFEIAPKGQSTNTTEGTIIMDFRKKNKAR